MATSSQIPGGFKPREDLLQMLLSTGITRNAAVKGLFYTGNDNAELAASWIFENDLPDIDAPLDIRTADLVLEYEGSDIDDSEFYKVVFVVNSSLNMGVGKIAAQVAHAAIGIYKQLIEDQPKYGTMLLHWEQFGETKVVLRGQSAAQLTELHKKAASNGVVAFLVEDAGQTQVAEGSLTVLAIMGSIQAVDQITGNLSLL